MLWPWGWRYVSVFGGPNSHIMMQSWPALGRGAGFYANNFELIQTWSGCIDVFLGGYKFDSRFPIHKTTKSEDALLYILRW